MKELKYQLRYALPLWFVLLILDWLPENRISQSLRGRFVARIIGSGRNLRLASGVKLLAVHNLELGDNVYLGPGVWVNALGGLKIEDEVMLGPYACVTSTSHGFSGNSVFRGGTHTARVVIGRGSWLGAHAVVTYGVRIGAGCIIGANTVVTKNVSPNKIAAGVPARVVSERVDNPGEIRTRSDV